MSTVSKITVIRYKFNGENTIGRMLVDGKFFCFTLEDTYRLIKTEADKVHSKTAIPYGTYKVALTKSARFGKVLPELLNVPFFGGIRIHGGNTEADTEGCILVGEHTDEKKIWNCPSKLKQLIELIKQSGKVIIEIKPEFG